jgi:hypothetical protein
MWKGEVGMTKLKVGFVGYQLLFRTKKRADLRDVVDVFREIDGVECLQVFILFCF